ncbi:Guanylate cyclase / Adenylate cyclase [Spironucleus salmonicida]|uniref:Cyclase homology and transmembrane domain-containing protein n=1 Tax=Spironucleus salmonicida TaxID=348837 RepID=V6LCN9_9EUKA|nr:Guanylate cyclase / Adenylate cyclase [Spironucleus salmonicida]|eukprot:EST42245.1 Cyclase homology and transmembrane domain-containing protein [Spironucleus salmonicida]
MNLDIPNLRDILITKAIGITMVLIQVLLYANVNVDLVIMLLLTSSLVFVFTLDYFISSLFSNNVQEINIKMNFRSFQHLVLYEKQGQINNLRNIQKQYLPNISLKTPFPHPINKEVSILILDLVGFTQFASDSTLSTTSTIISQFYDQISRFSLVFNGNIISYLGDGALILFETCIQAKNFVFQLSLQLHNDMKLSAGLHRGNVMIGAFSQSFNVIGDAVNLTSRVEQSTRLLKCNFLCTKESAISMSQFTRIAGEVHLKGKGAIQLFHVCDENIIKLTNQILKYEELQLYEDAYNFCIEALKIYHDDQIFIQKSKLLLKRIQIFQFDLKLT